MKSTNFSTNSPFGQKANHFSLIVSIKNYLGLCKWQITRTVVFTTALGYYLAHLHQNKTLNYFHFSLALLAIALVCAGACTVNHILESKSDSKMGRTKERPIPNGSITKTKASLWAIFLFVSGLVLLVKYFSWNLAIYSFSTAILYDFIYTPLKKKTKWNTSIGAISGAWPVSGGWMAGGGDDLLTTWLLFFILFFWQHPHFYAIAWMYRNDYEKAGFKMLPLGDTQGFKTFFFSIATAIPLLPLNLMLALRIKLGRVYLILSVVMGIWFIAEVLRGALKRTNRAARRIVLMSVLYILFWFVAIWLDRQMPIPL